MTWVPLCLYSSWVSLFKLQFITLASIIPLIVDNSWRFLPFINFWKNHPSYVSVCMYIYSCIFTNICWCVYKCIYKCFYICKYILFIYICKLFTYLFTYINLQTHDKDIGRISTSCGWVTIFHSISDLLSEFYKKLYFCLSNLKIKFKGRLAQGKVHKRHQFKYLLIYF